MDVGCVNYRLERIFYFGIMKTYMFKVIISETSLFNVRTSITEKYSICCQEDIIFKNKKVLI